MPTNRVVGTSFYTALKKASSVSCSTVDDLEEIITLTDDMMALQNTTSTMDEKVLDDLRTWKDRSDVVSQSFRKLLNDVESTSPAMMFQGIQKFNLNVTILMPLIFRRSYGSFRSFTSFRRYESFLG